MLAQTDTVTVEFVYDLSVPLLGPLLIAAIVLAVAGMGAWLIFWRANRSR